MERVFKKKRYIPLFILTMGSLFSFMYVVESAVTNRRIVTELKEKEDSTKRQIDSLRYANLVKDYTIFINNIDNTILELQTEQSNATTRKAQAIR